MHQIYVAVDRALFEGAEQVAAHIDGLGRWRLAISTRHFDHGVALGMAHDCHVLVAQGVLNQLVEDSRLLLLLSAQVGESLAHPVLQGWQTLFGARA